MARRAYFVDERGGALRVTWHYDRCLVVFSMWRGNTCVASCRLTPAEAVRLREFLSDVALPAPPVERGDRLAEP